MLSHRDAEAFDLNDQERELVRGLLELAVHAIELRCPELVVLTIDIELAAAVEPLSAA